LSKPFARTLFADLGPNVGFMEADLKNEYSGIRGLNALYRRLKAKRFTAVADMHGVLRSSYLRMRFNFDRFKVCHSDKHRKERRKMVASRNKRLIQHPSTVQNYADVLASLGYPVKLEFTSIFPPSGGNLRLLPPVVGEKKKFQLWIGVAPFAAHRGKVYPPEKMEMVIAKLLSLHPSGRVFLFGVGADERKYFSQWCAKYSRCTDASAALGGLKQELILMSHLDVMVSMDSANAHLASIVNVPVVSIWGATHPYTGFMAWNQKEDNVVQVDLPCRPCSIYGNKMCQRGDWACLDMINPETILEKVESVFKKTQKR
jgi:ADP-heptose:LPS heptosyltransferase